MPQPTAKRTRAFKRNAYEHLAAVGKALSNATRLELLELIVQGPRSVEELASELGQSVANTSHHLQALKAATLVQSERDGKRVVYTSRGSDVGHLLDSLQQVAATHSAELARLSSEFFQDADVQPPMDRSGLLQRISNNEAVLLDVRPQREFNAGHLNGALSIPLGELSSRLDELPSDKTIVAYCRGPYCVFSADAVRILREAGHEAVRAEVSAHSWLGLEASPSPLALQGEL